MVMMMKFVIGLIIVLCSVSIEIVESTSSPVKITRYSNSAWVESATAIPKKVEYVDSLEGVVLSEGTGPFSVTVETGIDLPDENRIKPAAAPLAPGNGAKLPPAFTQALANVILQLGRKRTGANPRRVGLGNSQNIVYGGWPHA